MKTERHIEVGLCQTCQHVKTIENANRSRFYMCLLSNSNADFQRYPRLPVLTCSGYHPENQIGNPEGDESR